MKTHFSAIKMQLNNAWLLMYVCLCVFYTISYHFLAPALFIYILLFYIYIIRNGYILMLFMPLF